jgi:hypothetical protein
LQSGVGNILGGTQEPSKAALRAIIREFDISPEWLISGSGGPRKTQDTPAGGPYVTEKDFAEWRGYWRGGTERLLEDLEAAKKQIADLARRLDQLEGSK